MPKKILNVPALLRLSAWTFRVTALVTFLCIPCRAQELPAAPPAEVSSDEEVSAVERREAEEKKARLAAFVITPHRQNYILPVTYNTRPNADTYEFAMEDAPKKLEVKFQLSFKILVWENVFRDDLDLYFGYTQLSLWQLYDEALSSPFRETNYEPEVFLKLDTDFEVLGMRVPLVTLGFDHESNGRGGSLSRSWNRIFAVVLAERGNFVIGLKPWYRVPEDAEDDDNPDIEDYMGYGELFGSYRYREHVISYMFRNNLRSDDNRSTVELGWSHPVKGNLRIYAQYFYGYGESLVDYNHISHRIGVGVMLNDWL